MDGVERPASPSAWHPTGRLPLWGIYTCTADLRPEVEGKALTVSFHPLACRAHDAALAHSCAELTTTETLYPGTHLRLIYQIVGSS